MRTDVAASEGSGRSGAEPGSVSRTRPYPARTRSVPAGCGPRLLRWRRPAVVPPVRGPGSVPDLLTEALAGMLQRPAGRH